MLRLWGPVAAWAVVIFAVSSLSFGPGGPGVSEWITHGGAYGVLSVLTCRALAGGFPLPLTWRGALLAVLISTAYGVSDEWHQSFVPQRHSSAADAFKDFIGAAIGALAYLRVTRWRLPQRILSFDYRGGIHSRRGAK